MRKRLAASALLVITCIATRGDLFACGDKFLVVGRGTRFRHASVPRRPAVILIYADPASNLPRALANVPVDATLRKAGYQPTSVASADEFDKALQEKAWDLVLVDEAEGQSLRARLRGDPAPIVLPVFYKATHAELKAAKKQYRLVLESPTRSQAFLDTIDEALALQPSPTADAAAKTTG